MIYTLGEHRPLLEGDGHFIVDNATVVGNVTLKTNVSIWFNAVLRGDNDRIFVGDNSNVQDGCVLHVDPGIPLTLGRSVTVGHMAMLHGCTINDNSLVGIGSIILNHATIGKDSIVGANSLITEGKEFPDGVLIVGSPAKVARELTADEIAFITWSAKHYVDNARNYGTHLKTK